MTKRKLLLIGAGISVCIVLYGILGNTLTTMHMQCKIINDVQHQLKSSFNDQQGVNQSQRRDNAILEEISEKALSNYTGIRPSDENTVSTSPEEMPCASVLREELLCELKKSVPFFTITRRHAYKDARNGIFPEESLEKLLHFNSCAVVSSSHALMLHEYGQEIDNHDIVLRFNCAPTDKFEHYVGSRTDIRMINTLIPHLHCQDEFWNENSTMFKDGILVVGNMDGINFGPRGSLDIKQHIRPSFSNLIKYRKKFPERVKPFIQRPRFGQAIMAELARFCETTGMCNKTRLRPSSGMLGIVMMLHLCDWVRVYELVPSNKDDTELMYYFDETTKWTSQHVHSYNQERVYVKTLSLTPAEDIKNAGVVLLKGFSQTQCG
ncbi:beta-galactoside alpha-2,6-sialyltransferase 2-like [Branchiostoma floridae x Branchiostoma japonicum]